MPTLSGIVKRPRASAASMDGRLITVLLTIALPLGLVAVNVYKFGSNPLVMLGLLIVMIGGGLYLLTYAETFGPAPSGGS